MKVTITEALADIKTSQARIEKKRAAVANFLARVANLRDPLEKEGGSVEFVRRERQSIHDLQEKIVAIRTAIQGANLTNTLTVEGQTRTVAAWLNWRREIAQPHANFLNHLSTLLARLRQSLRPGQSITTATAEAQPQDVVVNINEKELSDDMEKQATILGQLDGKLSLFNATVLIDVP